MKVASLRQDIAANIAGQAVPTVVGLIVVPIYVRMVGAEGYGLVGFLSSLQAVLTIMDLGLGVAVGREIARHGALREPAEKTRDLLRSLELIYLATAILACLSVAIASSWLSSHVISAEGLGQDTVRRCIVLMGVIVALRWPLSLYAGALRARSKQRPLNIVLVAESVLRGLSAALILTHVSSSVILLFWCFVGGAFLQLVLLVWLAWRAMPASTVRPRPRLAAWRSVRSFTLQISCVSLLATVLKQVDTILVAALLPLASLGHYTLAWTMGLGLLLLPSIVVASIGPRLVGCIATGDSGGASNLYHRSSQLVAFGVAPAGFALSFFSHDVLLLWTRAEGAAMSADIVLTVLSCAFVLNALTQVPLCFQIAAGQMSIQLWGNSLGVLILGPVMYFAISKGGIAGAGVSWLAFNLVSTLAGPRFMHTRLLPGEYWQWISRDCFPFIAVAGAAMWASYVTTRVVGGRLTFVPLSAAGFAVYLAITWRWCEPVASLVRQRTARFRLQS